MKLVREWAKLVIIAVIANLMTEVVLSIPNNIGSQNNTTQIIAKL